MSPSDVVPVRIADLVLHKAFQVRQELDVGTVTKYARGFELDGAIASVPILVGRIRPPEQATRGRQAQHLQTLQVGALVLLAGFHRVAACRMIGRETILARIVDTTAKEAQWLAAESNMTHGLPLKNVEIRLAFYAYLRADRHRDASGKRVQSLRDMGREFGKSHHTIHKWMNARDTKGEFRGDYEAYKTGEVFKDRPYTAPIPPTPTEKAAMNIHEALRQARALYPALGPDQRGELVAELRETLAAIEAGQPGSLEVQPAAELSA